MYTCPDCQSPLQDLRCLQCRREYSCRDGIPVLLPSNPRYQAAVEIAQAYDSIYSSRTNVWENQGRTAEFLSYYSALLNRIPCARFLEVGSGEGFLMAGLGFAEKFGVDLSTQAIKAARNRAHASFSIALAERLPFPSEFFDLVTSVGTMEHFLDLGEATREIARVLKPGGYYVALTHVNLTVLERLGFKISEYIFPRPRPVRFARWLKGRLKPRQTPDFPIQPINHRYTTRKAGECLEANGLDLVDVLHTRKHPQLPLDGPWVTIYIGQKVEPARTSTRVAACL